MNPSIMTSIAESAIKDPPPISTGNTYSEHGETDYAGTYMTHDGLRDEDDLADGQPGEFGIDAEKDLLADDDHSTVDEHYENVRLFALKDCADEPNDDDDRCQKCIDDETMSPADKNKHWGKGLDRHLRSSIHSPKLTWQRVQEASRKARGDNTWRCPYGGDECPTWQHRNKLIAHIEKSTAKNTSLEHDKKKRADGWYDADWDYSHEGTEKAIRDLVRCNQGYSEEVEMPPRQVSNTGLVITSCPGNVVRAIPSELSDMVFSGAGEVHPIPAKFRDVVFSGAGDVHPIPAKSRAVIRSGAVAADEWENESD